VRDRPLFLRKKFRLSNVSGEASRGVIKRKFVLYAPAKHGNRQKQYSEAHQGGDTAFWNVYPHGYINGRSVNLRAMTCSYFEYLSNKPIWQKANLLMQHDLVQQEKIEQKDMALNPGNFQPAFILYKTKHGDQKEALLASKRRTALQAETESNSSEIEVNLVKSTL
jgi:hypothetical protein